MALAPDVVRRNFRWLCRNPEQMDPVDRMSGVRTGTDRDGSVSVVDEVEVRIVFAEVADRRRRTVGRNRQS
jgi:hypothetical protein